MPDSEGNETHPTEQRPPASDAWGVLNTLAGRLRSQPLVLGLAVLLVLAIVATTAAASLRPLMPYALGVFAIALVAWLVAEILRMRAGAKGSGGYDVSVRAKDVAKGARVGGVANAPRDPGGAVKVRVDAESVKGSVSGVTFGDQKSGRG